MNALIQKHLLYAYHEPGFILVSFTISNPLLARGFDWTVSKSPLPTPSALTA